MIGRKRHKLPLQIVIIATGIIMVSVEAIAAGRLSGRYVLTYQDSRGAQFNSESFLQHYEATLRDQLFETTALSASIFFDNLKTLTTDRTIRRYRGEINLAHKNYSLNARITPRQKLTPLQLPVSREVAGNQLTFDLHLPKKPRLRLFFGNSRKYDQDEFTSRSRDFRGDVTYTHKFLYMALNRWNAKSDNGSEKTTTVTGGTIRLTKAIGTWLNVRSGYDHQLTETARLPAPEQSVLNQTFNMTLRSRYRRFVTAMLAMTTRHSTTEFETKSKNRDDTVRASLTFFPFYHVYGELLRSYIKSVQQNSPSTLSDYGTVQVIATLPPMKRFGGRAQVARRFEIKTENAGVPANLYFLSFMAQIYKGIDFRTELNVSQRHRDVTDQPRYQTLSLIDLFLRPRETMLIGPFLRYTNFSDHFTLLKNDRISYGATFAYRPTQRVTLGAEARRIKSTTRRLREDTAVTINTGLNLRNRTTLNVSYGVNQVDALAPRSVAEVNLDSRATTLNVQAQVWITRRGVLSLNYSSIDRDDGVNSEFVGLSFRQDI